MIYLLLGSFFFANVIYRIPVGRYGYILISDAASWLVIFFVLMRKLLLGLKWRELERLDWSLLLLNLLMFLLLFQVYFSAVRVFSEFGRAAVDTLRFTQFILCYYTVRSHLGSSSKSIRYLLCVFALATAVSAYGLIVDVWLRLPRMYAGITRDLLRPNEFSAFFTDNHASASIYLISALSVGFGFIFMKGKFLLRAVYVSCMAVIILAIIFSKSRAGLAGLSVSMALFLLYYMRYRGGSAISLMGLIVMAAIFGITGFYSITNKGVIDRVGIGSVEDITRYESRAPFIRSFDRRIAIVSIKSRFENWRESIEIIKGMSANIFFGYGVNQQSVKIGFGGAHNNFLQVMIDLGIVGLGVFLVILYEMGRTFEKPRNTGDSYAPHGAVRIGMRCGFWGLLATSFTQETFYMSPALGNFFGFYLILLAVTSSVPKETAPEESRTDR